MHLARDNRFCQIHFQARDNRFCHLQLYFALSAALFAAPPTARCIALTDATENNL